MKMVLLDEVRRACCGDSRREGFLAAERLGVNIQGRTLVGKSNAAANNTHCENTAARTLTWLDKSCLPIDGVWVSFEYYVLCSAMLRTDPIYDF